VDDLRHKSGAITFCQIHGNPFLDTQLHCSLASIKLYCFDKESC